MITNKDKNASRKTRHQRVRKKVSGTSQRPRFNVYRSLNHIYVQVIDDSKSETLVSASTLDPDVKAKISEMTKKQAAKLVGETAARRAAEKGITQVVFDRGGYIYHGRIMEVAAGAREAGLEF